MEYLKQMGAYHPKILLGIHSNAKGFPRIGSKKKPKQPTKTRRQMAREAVEKAGLHKTKAQRKAYEAAMTRVLGYKPAKLHDVVAKPSRYTVKKRITKYSVGTERQIKDVWEKEHFEKSSWWGGAPRLVPGRMVQKWVDVVVKKTPIGEKLIIKRLAKGGQGKGGGGSADRGTSHKTGSAVAKKSVARLAARLGGKRGGKPRREKKKKKG